MNVYCYILSYNYIIRVNVYCWSGKFLPALVPLRSLQLSTHLTPLYKPGYGAGSETRLNYDQESKGAFNQRATIQPTPHERDWTPLAMAQSSLSGLLEEVKIVKTTITIQTIFTFNKAMALPDTCVNNAAEDGKCSLLWNTVSPAVYGENKTYYSPKRTQCWYKRWPEGGHRYRQWKVCLDVEFYRSLSYIIGAKKKRERERGQSPSMSQTFKNHPPAELWK